MKTTFYILFSCVVFVACQKKSSNQSNNSSVTTTGSPSSPSFPSRLKVHALQKGSFLVTGACQATGTEWSNMAYNDIWTSNGQTWIDSLNYVVREALPITIVNDSTISFNTYTCSSTSYPFVITGGTGNLKFDTLRVTVTGNTGSSVWCPNTPLTFKGKYYKIQ